MKMTKRKKVVFASLGVLLAGVCLGLLMPGCTRGRAGNLVPVCGRVLIEGRPLTTGTVTFQPDLARGNASKNLPMGLIDEVGAYELFTVGKPGAAPGWYKVVVTASELSTAPSRPGQFPASKLLVHARYTDVRQTDLGVEVSNNSDGASCDLNLRR